MSWIQIEKLGENVDASWKAAKKIICICSVCNCINVIERLTQIGLSWYRFLAMFGSSLLPTGCERKWLVAVASHRCKSCLGHDEIPVRECLLHWKTLEDGYRDSSKIESILGALMVDTVAEFLPKRKLTPKRRFTELSLTSCNSSLPSCFVLAFRFSHLPALDHVCSLASNPEKIKVVNNMGGKSKWHSVFTLEGGGVDVMGSHVYPGVTFY